MNETRLHFEVVVVGAGPAGLAAACASAENGCRTALVDDTPWLGGQIWRGQQAHPTHPQAARWVERFRHSKAVLLDQCTVLGPGGPSLLLAEHSAGPRQIEWERLILATGARELFLPFPGWTLPGNFGPGGLQSLAKNGWPVTGQRIVLAGSGPLLLAVGGGLRKMGANIISINEQAPWSRLVSFGAGLLRWPAKLAQAARLRWTLRGTPFRCGVWPVAADGAEQVRSVTLSDGRRQWAEECDLLACGFGLAPNVELPLALGCQLDNGFVKVDPWQAGSVAGVYGAGELTGIGGADAALVEGLIAGLAASGRQDIPRPLLAQRASWHRFRAALATAFALREEVAHLAAAETLVCRCEDVAFDKMKNYAGWREAKLQTRCGMGPCQGRVCGAAARILFGWGMESVRPPVLPGRMESLCQGEGNRLNRSISLIALAFCLLTLPGAMVTAHAQAVTNTFTNPALDLVTNGVIGSGFDGADLNYGDVPGGNSAGLGNGGMTLAANSGASIGAPGSGFLVVQTINSAWGQGGPGDDGFFAFNVVEGDFTATVNVAGPYDNEGSVFSGLMARAISDGTGGPYDPTGTNASENWVSLTVFQEFGITTMSETMTNGDSVQIVNGSALDSSLYGLLTDDIYLQIQRAGDSFLLSASPDGVTWTPEMTIDRPDLYGAALQVGIEEATYNNTTPVIYFADYGVTGKQTIKPPGSDPTDIVVSAPASPTSLTVSWTPAPGSDGSIVVLSENRPIVQSPYYGFSYVGNPTNGAVLNMGALQQVVYAGSGSGVTVSGLGGSNNVYSLAVYSYTTNGGTTPMTYNATPATTNFNGPGTLSSISFVTTPSAIPVNGVGLAVVRACYTSGDCYNVSSSPNISLTSDAPSVLSISGEVMEGLSVGTANVTAVFVGIAGTNVVTVHNAVFSDNFTVPHDYITDGVLGTAWDGDYLNYGDVPGAQEYAGAFAGETTVLNADISDSNVLSLEASGSSWEGVGDDGPFLFKLVPGTVSGVSGDFQASVHVSTMSIIHLNAAGLMARLFDDSGTSTQGSAGGNGGETHVNWWRVQDGALSARYTLDGNAPTDQPGLNATDTWLLLQRVDSTNFYCYEAPTNNAGEWSLAATLVVPEAAGNAAMQVGIAEQMNTASDGTAQFDTFMLDAAGIVSPAGVQPPPAATGLTMTLNNDLSMTLNWISESNGTPIQSMVVMKAGSPVSAQPPYGYLFDSGPQPFGEGNYLGDGNWVVFGSANPPASVSNTTLVTGLTPGVTYYAAVYTWVGASSSKQFNEVIPPTGAAVLPDGVLTNVVVLPAPSIPVGGIGLLQVLGYYEGGAMVNVSQFADLTSGDTNILGTADGVVTGYALGKAEMTVTYAGYTDIVTVVVRPPSYADFFTTPHDYLNDGVGGTFFDGVYTNWGDFPDQEPAEQGTGSSTLQADAGITTPGMLTITNGYSGFEFDDDNGFFLFKYVLGDFQMAIHLNNYSDTVNYSIPSIMARAFSISTNGGSPNHPDVLMGAPLDGLGGECYVRMGRFDEYGIGTYPEITIDDNSDQTTQPAQGDGQDWLMLVRQDYTNFNVYQRSTNNQPWHLTPNKTSFSNAKFAGIPMQVGIQFSDFSDSYGYVQFDSFMLDVVPPQISSAGGFVTITWTETPASLLSSPSLSPAHWQPVSTAAAYNNGVASVTLPISRAYQYFALSQTPP